MRCAAWSARSTWSPVMRGMCRSSTAQSGSRSRLASRNSRPLAKASASRPEARSSRFSALRTGSSSSTIATYGTIWPLDQVGAPWVIGPRSHWTKVQCLPSLCAQRGQDEVERRPGAGGGGSPQAAVVRADDRARDRKPQAEPARLGRIEGLEELGVLLRREPRAAVAEADLHRAALDVDRAGAHPNPALLGRQARPGGAGVHHQIEHPLLELDPVALDLGQRRGELRHDLDRTRDEVAVDDAEDLVDQLVGVEGLELRFAALEEGAQAPDDLARPLVGGDDVAQDLHQDLGVGRFVADEVLGRLGVAEDRGERLVQLVGDAPGELAEHRDPREVRELEALLARVELDPGAL